MRNSSRKLSCVIFTAFILLLDGWWCNGQTVDEVAEMETTEKEALYTAIQGFVGNGWNGSDLYPDPCGWTPIQGVSCDLMDGFWYVTDLNIGPFHDNSLTCSQNPQFRPQMFELKHLKSLSFYNCFSSHNLITLPTVNWEKMAGRLESLEFRSNPSLVGSMPTVFSNLQMLQSLVLIENGLTGNLPSNIGSLRLLKRLVLSGNKFTGRVPDTLGNLSELLILDLSRNLLSGSIPSSIGSLKALLKLDLSNNMLVGTIPREISYLKNLTLLDVRSNNISGGLTRSLEELDSLQELVLSSNPIGGDMTNVGWQKLHNLMILDLSSVGLSGEVPLSVAKLTKLRYVGLGNNKLTGNLPSEVANMPSVSAFYVDRNNLTGKLGFSEGFYGRLGRRFGAWKNPNLCYPVELMSSGHTPLGVEPCKSQEITGIPGSKYQLGDGYKIQQHQQPPVLITSPAESKDPSQDYMSSVGSSRCGIDGVWWAFLLESFMMFLVWNFFL